LAELWDEYIINETKDELPDADDWAEKEDKLDLLKEEWD